MNYNHSKLRGGEYVAPSLDVLDIEIEQGFSMTLGGDGTPDEDYGGEDQGDY